MKKDDGVMTYLKHCRDMQQGSEQLLRLLRQEHPAIIHMLTRNKGG